jgi:hypothetical protein
MAKVTVTLGARGKMCVVIGVGIGAPAHGQGFDSWSAALVWCDTQGFEVSNRAAAAEIARAEFDAAISEMDVDTPMETTASKPTTFAEGPATLREALDAASAKTLDPHEIMNSLAQTCHNDAKAKGWWDGVSLPLTVTVERERLLAEEKLMLIVTEASEAMEEIRDGHEFTSIYEDQRPMLPVRGPKPLGFPIELADIVIRVFGLAAACGVDLGAAVKRKMEFNRTREHRHGGKLS